MDEFVREKGKVIFYHFYVFMHGVERICMHIEWRMDWGLGKMKMTKVGDYFYVYDMTRYMHVVCMGKGVCTRDALV